MIRHAVPEFIDSPAVGNEGNFRISVRCQMSGASHNNRPFPCQRPLFGEGSAALLRGERRPGATLAARSKAAIVAEGTRMSGNCGMASRIILEG